MQAHTMWGLGLGLLAGAATTAVATDHGLDLGLGSGVVLPATLATATVGATVLAATGRAHWRWSGVPALAGAAQISRTPLAAMTLGATAGLGLAALLDAIWPAGNGEPSAQRARELAAEATRLDAEADSRRAEEERVTAGARTRRDEAAGRLDDALDPSGGRLGGRGTVGEGRLDVTGMSPAAAADTVLDAYASKDRQLRRSSIRVDGPNVFSASRIASTETLTERELVTFFRDEVDTQEPEGVIDRDEARRWQAGERSEVRMTGVDGLDELDVDSAEEDAS